MAELYSPIYFSNVIDELPDRFFIQGEFPLSREKDEVLKTAALLDDPSFDKTLLTGQQLEDLIFCLVYRPSDKISNILCERVTGRLLGLLWAFFQYNYNNDNLLAALCAIEKNRNRAEFEKDKGVIIFDKGFLADAIGNLAGRVLSKQEKLKELIQKADILPDSPFYRDLITRIFIQAGPDIFNENIEYLMKLFESGPIPIVAFIRYLDVFPPERFSPEVNKIIFDRFGFPGQSDFWKDYPPAMAAKLLDWNKIYRISQAYPVDSRKYKFLSKYSSKIKETRFEEDVNILKILFGHFNIIDDMRDDASFIFCADPQASLEVRDTRRLVVQYSAKDYIVRGTQAEYMHINLSGLDKMYADELFDILLDA